METRRKRKNTSNDLDMGNPKNWKKERLLNEIQKIGIKVPSNLKVTSLIQIYNENKKDYSINMVPTDSAPSEELISAAESAAAMV